MENMDERNVTTVHQLFLLNISLQLFDGVATYYGISTPWHEGNPILGAAMANLGIGVGLLLFKSGACAALVALRAMAGRPLITRTMTGLAAAYGCFSFVPWTARNILLLA
jgi:hypothetical protein